MEPVVEGERGTAGSMNRTPTKARAVRRCCCLCRAPFMEPAFRGTV
jgi:hypothetical protein